jgi:hypothetical protein
VVATLVTASLVIYYAFLGGRSFTFDPARPFRVDFGRGSWWMGFDTVSIAEDGSALLYRRFGPNFNRWERATIKLTPAQLRTVNEGIVRNGLLGLQEEYKDPAIVDGTQWVLWLRQDGREKLVHCDNRFPPELVAFADALEELMAKAAEKASWEDIGGDRHHERVLRASIER